MPESGNTLNACSMVSSRRDSDTPTLAITAIPDIMAATSSVGHQPAIMYHLFRQPPGFSQCVHATKYRFSPREQFSDTERLCKIIIRTQLEPQNTVKFRHLRRQHQHMNISMLLPDTPANLQPVQFWQHNIQNNQLVSLAGNHGDRPHSICGMIDIITFFTEMQLQQIGDIGIVFNSQNLSRTGYKRPAFDSRILHPV